jgi:hypothetical protein
MSLAGAQMSWPPVGAGALMLDTVGDASPSEVT